MKPSVRLQQHMVAYWNSHTISCRTKNVCSEGQKNICKFQKKVLTNEKQSAILIKLSAEHKVADDGSEKILEKV